MRIESDSAQLGIEAARASERGAIDNDGSQAAFLTALRRGDDAVYEQLDPEQQQVAKRIFLRLAEPGRGTEDTRRRASLTELLPGGDEQAAVEEVLDILARARLVTVGLDAVEVAHEALIREWPLLRRWLDEDREGLQIHRRLTDDSNEWLRFERDPSQLYRGARLHAALEWADERHGALSPTEREFLDASRAAEETELERSKRRQRRPPARAAPQLCQRRARQLQRPTRRRMRQSPARRRRCPLLQSTPRRSRHATPKS